MQDNKTTSPRIDDVCTAPATTVRSVHCRYTRDSLYFRLIPRQQNHLPYSTTRHGLLLVTCTRHSSSSFFTFIFFFSFVFSLSSSFLSNSAPSLHIKSSLPPFLAFLPSPSSPPTILLPPYRFRPLFPRPW